jgi:hypothetical protein
MISTPFAFRILGGTDNQRHVVDYAAAFRAYCAADPAARPEIPAYLSAFNFGDQFRHLMESTGSVRGYDGPVGIASVKWDIDREGDLDAALRDARILAVCLADDYDVDDGHLLIGFSGSKGFHLELPVGWTIDPTPCANLVCRKFAQTIADEVGITIDIGVYDRVRPFRAWNSKHPKTGRHKTKIKLDDLLNATPKWITDRAAGPIPFEPPAPMSSPSLVAAWEGASLAVRHQEEERQSRQSGRSDASINALTRRFIIDSTEVEVGSRHARLFSAAANLAEFATVTDLVHALLTEPGLDTGLSPREVRRQIECGIEHARHQTTKGVVANG